MAEPKEIELIFEPQDEGGYHVYAPELRGLHTQGDDLKDAISNAEEALALYVDALREEGGSLEFGVIRRNFPTACVRPKQPVISGAQPIRALERDGWNVVRNAVAAVGGDQAAALS